MYTLPEFAQEDLIGYLDLVGLEEIAGRVGVSGSTINDWLERFDDFPTPVVRVRMPPMWRWLEVERWMSRRQL